MISILLPSLREELLNKRVVEFALTNPTTQYQLVVVSPFEVKGPNVKWLKDVPPFKGSVRATNFALGSAIGEYIMYFSDDVSPTKDCLKNMIEFVKANEMGNINPFVGAFRMNRDNGAEIGPWGVFGYPYACYGVVSRASLLKLGNVLFNHNYLYSWVDCDLSMRVWDLGGKVEICENAIVIPKQVDDEVYRSHRTTFNQDFNTFANKWHPKYGEGIPREIGTINRRLK